MQKQEELSEYLDKTFCSFVHSAESNKSSRSVMMTLSGDFVRGPERRSGLLVSGLDSSGDVDYVYWKWFSTQENESEYTYFCDNGVWDISLLRGRSELVRQILEVLEHMGSRTDFISTPPEIERYNNLQQELDSKIQKERRLYGIDDIINLVLDADFQTLKSVIAPDGNDIQEFWKLLFSRQDGSVVENDIEVLYNDDRIALFRTLRSYESNGRVYPFVLVTGIDDTPDRFFVHRLPRCHMTDDEDWDWSKQDIRNIMGFEVDYNDINGIIPRDKITRIQGNLRIIPEDTHENRRYCSKKIANVLEQSIVSLMQSEYLGSLEYSFNQDGWQPEISAPRTVNMSTDGKDTIHIADSDTTPEVRSYQEKLEIKESEVRKRQKQRDIGRLSARLRHEIISDIFYDNALSWVLDNRNLDEITKKLTDSIFHTSQVDSQVPELIDELSKQGIREAAEQHVDEIFNDTRQVNMRFENHIVIAGSAVSYPLPNNLQSRIRLDKIIVPDESRLLIEHDEHNTRIYKLLEGVYEFRYLIDLNPDDMATNSLLYSNPLVDM